MTVFCVQCASFIKNQIYYWNVLNKEIYWNKPYTADNNEVFQDVLYDCSILHIILVAYGFGKKREKKWEEKKETSI